MTTEPPACGSRLQNDTAYVRLKTAVIQHTGLAYYNDKDDILASRIERRLAARNCRDCGQYLALISVPQGSEELDALITELTVGETFFFRYSEQYDALRELVFPDILRRNRHARRLRVWSAGCSNGAEAYSVAILLRRAFGALLHGWDVSITGTDINRAFLGQASAGRYGTWSLRDMPADVRDDCFVPENGQWTLKPAYREWVSFQYHNLIRHALPSIAQNLAAFDVILCRNVMIYFAPEVIDSLLMRFEQCMSAGSWLLVGHAETMPQLNSLFLPVSVPGATVYQKRQSALPTGATVAGGNQDAIDSVAQLLSPVPSTLAPTPAGGAGEEASRRKDSKRRANGSSAAAGRRPAPSIERMLLLANMGELEAAAALCRDLLARSPVDPDLHFFHGIINSQIDRTDIAESSLKQAIALKGAAFALAHYHLGLIHRARQPVQARRDFMAALEAVVDLDGDLLLDGGDGMRVSELVEVAGLQMELLSRS